MLQEMHGTIVCGVVDAPEGRAAAQLAGALAARVGLRLVLVHVISDPAPGDSDAAHVADRAIESALGVLERRDDVDRRVVAGSRVDALAQVAAEEGADVIVIGSRPRGARGRQLRCTLARELEAVQAVPVLIAPPATRKRSRRRLALADAAADR